MGEQSAEARGPVFAKFSANNTVSYQPIENYGIIGNLSTIALVGLDGSIDFCCFPRFDSPSVFARLLDDKKGGSFSISPEFKQMKTRQLYLPDTNVLLTRFLSSDGVGEITDFMPVGQPAVRKLVRRLMTIRGEVKYRLACCPRFNYGKDRHTIKQQGTNEIIFQSDGLTVRLQASIPLKIKAGDAVAEFTLKAGETADFLIENAENAATSEDQFSQTLTAALFETIHYWKDWIGRSTYRGRWMEVVHRSALVLKLLTSCEYGSIIAAPTFGLPEIIGGNRNWDYRYSWIRDASFTIYSFLRLGYTKEAGAFMGWIEKICRDIKEQERLGIMYSIDGRRLLEEKHLDNFEGYKASSPVRIGNDAYAQLQLDIYGELMDSVYLYNKYGEPISYDFWKNLESQMDWLSANWDQADDSIWEVRGGKKNFLYSRLACWVALDRAIKIAQARSFPINGHWKEQRDKIYNSIFKDFWDEKQQAFMQFPGAATVDASSLLMPLFRFISPKDPKWLLTLKKIDENLVTDSLVYRYQPESAAKKEPFLCVRSGSWNVFPGRASWIRRDFILRRCWDMPITWDCIRSSWVLKENTWVISPRLSRIWPLSALPIT
jgi:GH15 family glucan-1,4-alpha-glucosidase